MEIEGFSSDEDEPVAEHFNPNDQLSVYMPLLEVVVSCLSVREDTEVTGRFLTSLKDQFRTLLETLPKV